MFAVLKNTTYRHLFLAQVISLVGTGLGTVALGLLAFDLAGENAGAVLGTAFAIKMIAYVSLAPIAGAFADVVPRRAMLVGLDVVRAFIVAALPFVTEIWQVYVLIFVLQAASAAFTPTFQATIPDVLPAERDYTKALSLSRLAYDLENLISPMLAGALLTVVSFHELFAGTFVGFVASALFVVSVVLPRLPSGKRKSVYDRTTRGMRIYLKTPRLRGLLAVNMAVAAAGAVVIVNTVVYVQSAFGLSERDTAMALAAFGAGSMVIAILLPRLLERVTDRPFILLGGVMLSAGAFIASIMGTYPALLGLWFMLGCGYSMALTPSGRLLKRSAHAEDRPAIFAAQFALSHACWLVTYPLAGWLGSKAGLPAAALVLASLASLGTIAAMLLWPRTETGALEHTHPELPADHPHLQSGERRSAHTHAHPYVIDDLHFMWPHGR
jgi:H+ antiporter protein